MKTAQRRSPLSYIPGYENNAVLQLIVACCTGFISFHLCRVVLLIVNAQPETFPHIFTQNLSLPVLERFSHKWWTIFTYGWIHNGFWELFSNMIWLYAFGSVVQMLVGYKQIIPIFIFSMVMGGVFYELCQLIPGQAFATFPYLLGAQAAITGITTAALTIAPNYRFYIGDRFSIPMAVLAIIFFALMVMNSNLHVPSLFLLAGGAATGFAYIKLLQRGNRPGTWMYDIFDRLERSVTPDDNAKANKGRKRRDVLDHMHEPKQSNTQKRIDDILDKINQKGYDSLTKEEKEILMNAGKDKDA